MAGCGEGQRRARGARPALSVRLPKDSAVASLAFVGISPLRGAELTRCDVSGAAGPGRGTCVMDHRYQPASAWADRVAAVTGVEPVG